MMNPIFWKKVQGQKHPGRWGIVEHQIPSIKVLFKTNTKGHKHPDIRLLSKSKTQLVNQRKQKVAFNLGTAHSPEIQSYRMWWLDEPGHQQQWHWTCLYIPGLGQEVLTWATTIFLNSDFYILSQNFFPNFNSATKVWAWSSNFIPHFTMDVITYPC